MILVVGDAMTDIIVRPAGPLQWGTDTPAEIATRPGGSGANIACWIGHLGGLAGFAGRLGSADAAAQEAALRAHGVIPFLVLDATAETGRTVAVLDPSGERSFYTDRGANLRLCAADLPASLLEGCAALHVSGHTLLAPPGARAAARGLMRAARSRGIPVSVDAASPAPLRAAGREAFLAWTEDAATCFCNEAEAAILCGDGLRFACLIVTCGGAGADVIAGGTRVTAGAAAAIVRDTTGAGDAFTAAALLGMRRNLPLSQWLADALSAGARAVGLTGARPPLPGGPG